MEDSEKFYRHMQWIEDSPRLVMDHYFEKGSRLDAKKSEFVQDVSRNRGLLMRSIEVYGVWHYREMGIGKLVQTARTLAMLKSLIL